MAIRGAGRRVPRRTGARKGIALGVVVAVAGLSGAIAAPPASAEPGVPSPPIPVYAENFDNNPNTGSPGKLDGYAGATGQRYAADPKWLTNCNGYIASASQPVDDPGALSRAECWNQSNWNRVQQLSYALGKHAGQSDAQARGNQAVSAYTSADPGAGLVEFRTVDNVPFTARNRFLTFSVDVAALNCEVSTPRLQFYLVDDGGNRTAVGSELDGCTGAAEISVPPLGTVAATAVGVETYTANSAVLVSGSSVGVAMVNNNGSGAGNDHAFDNIRILDVTPNLDKAFDPPSVLPYETSRVTFTITNTSELGAKNGWSFTDRLPGGLVVTDPAATTDCPAGQVTATSGSDTVTVRGDLSVGMTSCTVTLNVTGTQPGKHVNGPDNITTSGLNPAPPATLEIIPQQPGLTVAKTASPAAVSAVGDTVTYTFTVTNTGNVALANVTLTEGAFSGTGGKPVVNCPPEASSLAPGKVLTCTATYRITQPDLDSGRVTNSAFAEGTPPGATTPTRSPETQTAVDTDRRPGVSVIKSASADGVDAAGEEVTYSFSVTNTGNVTLTEVRVDEAAFSGTGAVPAATCPPGPLAPGATTTCTATYTATQADVDAGRITNSATATATPPAGLPPITSSPSGAEVTIPRTASLTMTKSVSPAEVRSPGDTVTYSFSVTNTGNVTLTEVRVDEVAFSGTGAVPAATCPQGPLAPGATTTCTATYEPTPADMAAGGVSNVATASGTGPDGAQVTSAPGAVHLTVAPAAAGPPAAEPLASTGYHPGLPLAVGLLLLLMGGGAYLITQIRRENARL
ncbi:DUF7507 domain-containing protein [Saccharothrix obliqua]|uniref:DUF7507 domain-containing protein n=1 Tax=Saccharothrix obliqua TaxID=2861747 RepID=UPI001C5E1843|nr:DUF11 domain-containing protein [Saccharothrix obliqua]MBW4721428.1 DUF11 domain-containing protein [Saccharothrix obliqua]